MNRVLAAFVFLALLLIGGWLWLDGNSAPPAPAPSRDADANPSASSREANLDTKPQRNERVPGQAQADPTETDAPTDATFTVVGRCTTAADGAPLDGCTIQLRIERGDDRSAESTSADEWADAILTSSDATGAFRQHATHDDWSDTIVVRISKPGFVPRVARWPQPRLGSEVDLGDVPMLRAIRVTGQVVDRSGVPVEDAGMLFAYIELTGEHPATTENMLRKRSDAAGRFSFDAPAHPGEWYIGAEDTGALVEPRSVKLTDESSFELRVVVERPDPDFHITGTAVDTAGQPIAGLRLSASGEGFMGRGRSRADGSFVVQRAGPIPDRGKTGTALSISDPSGLYERVEPSVDTRIPWGKDGVRIVMRKRASRTVRVIDQNGAPVEAYTLFVFRGRSRLGIYRNKTRRGTHEDGRCRLEGLQAGPHAVVVMPRDEAFASTQRIAFVVEPETESGEVTVTLEPHIPTTVRVVDAAGAAMAGSQVELLQSLCPDAPSARSQAVELRDCDRQRGTPEYLVLARAITDASGDARLDAPRGNFHVRVTGAAHVPAVQAAVIGAPTTRLQVPVQAAARLTGTVQPADALARLREVSRDGKQPVAIVVKPDDQPALPAVAVAEDGSFAVGGMPGGRYKVSLRYWLRTGAVRADNVAIRVAEVSVVAGQERNLTIDASGLLPGTVQGRILAGGEPLRDVHCFLDRRDQGSMLRLRITTDGDGRFRGVVPAGDYGFSMTYPAQPGPGWLNMVLPDRWHLDPEQTHELQLDVPLRRVRLQLLDADGKPHVDARIRVVRTGYFLPGGLKTDATGTVEIYPAPLQEFHVDMTIGDEKQRLGPFDLPAGETSGTIVGRSG